MSRTPFALSLLLGTVCCSCRSLHFSTVTRQLADAAPELCSVRSARTRTVKSPYPGSSVGPFLAHRNRRDDGLAQRPQPVMSISHTVARPLPLHRRRFVCPTGPGVLAPEDPPPPEMFRRQAGGWTPRPPIARRSFEKPVPSPAPGRRLRALPLGRRRFAIEMPRTGAPADGLKS
jgi:hypothetical protein